MGHRRVQKNAAITISSVAAWRGAWRPSLADDGLVLVDAVVVAGDGASADVGAFADLRVAEIGEMAGLGAFAELRFLGFDEVADVRVLADLAAGAEVREGADLRAIGDGGILKHRALAD